MATQQAVQVMDNALATAMYATCYSVNYTMRISPKAFTFNKDMFVDVYLLTDLITISNRQQ